MFLFFLVVCRRMVQRWVWEVPRLQAQTPESTYCRCQPFRWPSSCSSITEKSALSRWGCSDAPYLHWLFYTPLWGDPVWPIWFLSTCRRSSRRLIFQRGSWCERCSLWPVESPRREFSPRSQSPRRLKMAMCLQSMISLHPNCTESKYRQVGKGTLLKSSILIQKWGYC